MSKLASMLVVLFIGSCGESDKCAAPTETTFSCDPLTSASSGCLGGPMWRSIFGPEDAPLQQQAASAIFPKGCVAEIPECSPVHHATRTFTCDGTSWSEPL